MMDSKAKIKKISKRIALLLIIGSIIAGVSLLGGVIANRFGLQYRAFVLGILWAVFLLLALGIVGCVVWLLGTLFSYPLKTQLHRVLLKLGCAVAIAVVVVATVWGGFLALLVFAFTMPEEKTAVVDGVTYVARLETTGLETTGISYHKPVGGLFCQQQGWETSFDYELWTSYR
jgi:hypothetical protein